MSAFIMASVAFAFSIVALLRAGVAEANVQSLRRIMQPSEPAQISAGPTLQIREVVRSSAKPQDSSGWQEIMRAVKNTGISRMDVCASGRRGWVIAIDTRIRKLERVAVAARLWHDEPSIEAQDELVAALRDVGIEASRTLPEMAP